MLSAYSLLCSWLLMASGSVGLVYDCNVVLIVSLVTNDTVQYRVFLLVVLHCSNFYLCLLYEELFI